MISSSLSQLFPKIRTNVRTYSTVPAGPSSLPWAAARHRFGLWRAARLRRWVTLPGGQRALLRAIQPDDERAHMAFAHRLSSEDIRARFFHDVRELPPQEISRLTHVDPEREMAFIAVSAAETGTTETLGVVRAAIDECGETAEVAIILRSDLKGLGLGTALLDVMVRYARRRGLRQLNGQVLPGNRAMLRLARKFGAEVYEDSTGGVWEFAIDLRHVAARLDYSI